MTITYCSVCGARIKVAELKAGVDPKCDDCLAGKPFRRSRRGDSAMIPKKRQSTGTILRRIEKDVRKERNDD
jgi:hypothetical protein